MKRGISLVAPLLALLLPVAANAGQDNLNEAVRGDYAFSGEAICLGTHAAPGTLGTFHAPNPGALIVSYTVSGVLHFNGDGTGSTVSGRSVSINHNVNRDPNGNFVSLGTAGAQTFVGDFTYTVAPDHSIHVERGPLAVTGIIGPNANSPGAIEVWKGIKFEGHVSQDFQTIVVGTPLNADNTMVVEIGYKGDGTTYDQARICHRSRTFIKLGGDNSRLSANPFSRD